MLRFSLISSLKLNYNFLDAIIAVSETARSELKTLFNSNRIRTLYNGVDTSFFRPGLEGSFRKGHPQLLFVGNLYQHKNVPELLFALKKLLNVYPKAYLQIVGTGYAYKSLENMVAKWGLEEHVGLTGFVPKYYLPYYYASCDIYLTASGWELFDLPMVEAMTSGKPVVASSINAHFRNL